MPFWVSRTKISSSLATEFGVRLSASELNATKRPSVLSCENTGPSMTPEFESPISPAVERLISVTVGGSVQSLVQLSKSLLLPSSHCSSPSTTPSPQTCDSASAGDAVASIASPLASGVVGRASASAARASGRGVAASTGSGAASTGSGAASSMGDVASLELRRASATTTAASLEFCRASATTTGASVELRCASGAANAASGTALGASTTWG